MKNIFWLSIALGCLLTSCSRTVLRNDLALSALHCPVAVGTEGWLVPSWVIVQVQEGYHQ